MANTNNTKEQTKKFFIYARKSMDTEDRQVRSIGDQISELQELAQKENLEIVDIIVEKQTAKKPGRSMFIALKKVCVIDVLKMSLHKKKKFYYK